MKSTFVIAIGITVVAGAMVVFKLKQTITPPTPSAKTESPTPAASAAPSASVGQSSPPTPTLPSQKSDSVYRNSSADPSLLTRSPKQSPPKSAQALGPQPKQNKPFIVPDPSKPIERQALSLVGADPAAEAYWVDSINDLNISAHDRSDLIEDLNEEGFENPRAPTFDDLPMIENRLALIESLAPNSMDEVNAAAFAEAYKDLVNMRTRVTGK